MTGNNTLAPLRLLSATLMIAAAMLAGCKSRSSTDPKSADPSPGAPPTAGEAEPTPPAETPGYSQAGGALTVGVVYRGRKDDGGYNQAHAAGALALGRMRGVKVVELESVAENDPVKQAFDKLVGLQDAALVFATGFGHFDPFMIEAAQRYPKTTFVHCGGYLREGLHPTNAGSFYAYLEEAHYVAGIAAGLTTKKKKMGFVASRPIPHVLRSVNAFIMGARASNPKVTTHVVFTGEWSAPDTEMAEAEKLFKQGIDVLAMYVDAPQALIEAAEKRRLFTVGVHVDQSALAPKGFITGAEWKWDKIYTDHANWVRDKKELPKIVRGGFKEGYVKLSPFGPAVSSEARARAEQARTQLADGSLVIFRGPVKDNRGREVLPMGKEIIPRDLRLEQIDYLVEGAVGKLPE